MGSFLIEEAADAATVGWAGRVLWDEVLPGEVRELPTQTPAAGTVGENFKDKASIAGLFGSHPGGEVSWKLYENSKREGQALASDGPVAVSANGEYSTPSGASPTQAGTYYRVASYSGDQNNKAAASGCADEPIVPPAPVPQPTVAVLPSKVTSGLVTLHGPQACVVQPSRVFVKGREIKSVTFLVNGRKVKTVKRPATPGRGGEWAGARPGARVRGRRPCGLTLVPPLVGPLAGASLVTVGGGM
jgi:hypothetical protein